ncbi:heme utilization protein HutZ [Thiomicrorhabdus immobilis]|uniref:Heme utilization protein HutZ n=1 Tax=Thiomicrorhabdus immobilis TaxID=2791037 RepID=A0ABM7MFA8_9GAMM|nr:pyridoxamine 5'-phosphate oxidase family protein [Thiomicrorhabdus immobilis]BCN94131.1 heme utilization protein HutZ [Thiomicrorhabdus immobilis]
MTNQQQCEAFFESRKTLILSTVDSKGGLETSVAPFVFHNGKVFIFVSELAKHTQNLLWLIEQNQTLTNNRLPGLVGGLLLADESQTEQLFARERMTLQLLASEVDKHSQQYAELLELFQQQFGEVVELLSGLSDFHMIELAIQNGGYVKGFGQAFAFENNPCSGLTPITRN